MTDRWSDMIRRMHDESWDLDWYAHVAELNEQLGLTGPDAFGLPRGLPPSWVVGDLEALPPGEWVLVVSLNQARREDGEAWHVEQGYTRQSYWDHWRFLNRNWWEPRFYRPLVRLAATALGVTVDVSDEGEFATSRMVFIELCPYPSRRFEFDGPTVQRLADEDWGFQTAARIRRLLIEDGSPAVVMVNGVAAVTEFQRLHPDVALERRVYPSVSRGRDLKHWEGHYGFAGKRVSVAGFPFLRKPFTHNSYEEIEQLGVMVHELRQRDRTALSG